jgi:RHS repeat-associated protein
VPPANTYAPFITGGTVWVGQTLSTNPGYWSGTTPLTYSYQWEVCNSLGGSCAFISGATSSTFTLTSSYVGDMIIFQVTASNTSLLGGGTAIASSAAFGVVRALPPANTAVPAITGTAIAGQMLTASPGTWSGTTPLTYSYQWEDCNSFGQGCSFISGATSSTYLLTSSDGGHKIVVEVIASNASLVGGGTAITSSAATGVVPPLPPADTALPAITGAATAGQVLTASSGTWSGTTPLTYSYQWQDCNSSGGSCVNISGATASTYTLAGSDAGYTIAVRVIASNASLPGGSTATASSAATGVVQVSPPAITAVPAITGTATAGQVLTASSGTWSGTTPLTYSYQWQDCNSSGGSCVNISGATAATYTVGSSDVGYTIVVQVVASNTVLVGGGTAIASSAATGVVQAVPPANTALPAITGTATAGQVMTASSGMWSGTTPLTYSYQWEDCDSSGASCTSISGATSSTYALAGSDVGHKIVVQIVASNTSLTGGGTAVASSAATGVVQAVPPAITAVPAITGTATAGQVLTASSGTWAGTTPLTYSYQWQDCNSSGGSCVNISGATASTYALASSDVGDAVIVEVSASNLTLTGGGTATASSTATAVAPANTAAPTITGTAQSGQTLTASNGTWLGSGLTYSYQWEDCSSPAEISCSNISGATSSTYTLQPSDAGSYITVIVSATAASAVGTASSAGALVGDSSSYLGDVEAAGPDALWQLDDGSLPVAFDSSGAGNNATYSSGVTDAMLDQPGFGTGSEGSTGLTGDSSAYVQFPASLLPTSLQAFAAQVWFKTSSPSGIILGGESSLGGTPTTYTPILYVDSSGYLEGQLWSDGSMHPLVSLAPVDDGSWHEAVLSVTSAGVEALSVDGTVQAAGTLGSTVQTESYATIGAGVSTGWPDGVSGWTGFDGQIADVALYDSALSGSTIETQYDAARPTPGNTALPTISGTAAVGDTLIASPGTWSGAPTTFAYQWLSCDSSGGSCANISGATGDTYTPVAGDLGTTVQVAVTASNTDASAAATSAVTGVIAQATTADTISYTGAVQSWTVPSGVTSIEVTVDGASGAGPYGGFGAQVQATMPVTPGEILDVYVGGAGSGSTGGFNGGGDGISGGPGPNAGGGATDIRIGGDDLSDRVIVAGGGGGQAGCNSASTTLGEGGSGGQNGQDGGAGTGYPGFPGGGGGTQTAGGAGGLDGDSGSLGDGGPTGWCGGDGGGGYYGGGAGASESCTACSFAGGGGGSSYAESSATDVSYFQGFQVGNGAVTIAYPASSSSSSDAASGLTYFGDTGSPQTWTVPSGVTTIAAIVAGGAGAGANGGPGAVVQATIPVTPGATLDIYVGGEGSGQNGGYNGGAGGNFGGSGDVGGGGGSDIRIGGTALSDRVIVAGGGGGAADTTCGGSASGGAGGEIGGTGGSGGSGTGGGGGTQTSGGSVGSSSYGLSGGLGTGGGRGWCDGDGGGGYYGGGAGSGGTGVGSPAGGGGGSSYVETSATSYEIVGGVVPGNGSVEIDTGVDGTIPPGGLRGTNPAIPGACPCDVFAGDPVNTQTGDLNESTTDASVSTFGEPLDFTRTYDSSLAQTQAAAGTPGPLGFGWTDNWNMSLNINSQVITVNEADGSQVQFTPPVDGACVEPDVGSGDAGTYCVLPDVTASLTYDSATSTYMFITHPYESYTFNAAGELTSETGPGGAATTVAYDTPSPGSGACPSSATSCETVSTASGRSLVIASNSAGLVTSVTDPRGNSWTYGYCATSSDTCSTGDLTSVTDADTAGNVTSYTYDARNSDPGLADDLLTITKPNGQPGGRDAGDSLVNTYNGAGQVISQTDPDGNETTFDYSHMYVGGNGYTLVTDPDGNETQYSYTNGLLTSRRKGYGTSSPSTSSYSPDPDTDLNDATTNPDHQTTSYTYDADGNLTSTTNPLGEESTASYNSFDEPVCQTLPLASSPCSSLSPPSAITDGGTVSPPSAAPPKYVTYSQYDTDGNLVWTTTGDYNPGASSASQSHTSYDLYGGESVTIDGTDDGCAANAPFSTLPCASIDPDGVVIQLRYDADGDLSGSSTPDGNSGGEIAQTTYGYDADGDQTSKVVPDGNLSGADAADYKTVSTYNGDDQLATATVSETGGSIVARETQYLYDPDGNLGSVEDARDHTTIYRYNGDDERTLVQDPDGNQTLTCYDGDGNIAETVPAVGVAANSLTPTSCPSTSGQSYTYGDRLASDATTYSYDVLADKTVITTPAPAGLTGLETTTNQYDANGQLMTTSAPPASTSTGAPNQVTNDSYDAAGELLTVTDAGSDGTAASMTSYCYDPDGNRTATVAPDGNRSLTAATCSTGAPYQTDSDYQTGYQYDSLGQLVRQTRPATSSAPDGQTTTYSYDPDGNVLTSKDPKGVTTTNTYTPLDQVASVSYSGSAAPSVSYQYDANGNRLSMSDGTGTSHYTYDVFNELKSYENGAGSTVSYSYNDDGGVSGISYPLDGASWADGNDTVAYGYDSADEMTSVTPFNGSVIDIGNTADGLPDSETLGESGDTIGTSYDNTDTPSAITLSNGSSTLQEFSYSDEPSGAIATETDTPSSSTEPADYTYDAQGRVTQMTPGTSSALGYGYDASGNATTLRTGATGTYDDAGELTSSTQGGTTTNYTYNADGERTQHAAGGTTTITASYNGAQQLTAYNDTSANMSAASYDGDGLRQTDTIAGTTQNFTWDVSGTVPRLLMDSTNAYIYGPGSTPIKEINLSSGSVDYLVSDQLGSVRGIVDSSGDLDASTSYDAWGNPQTTGGLSSYTPFGYADGYTDATGLTYLINRYYDPTTAQFLTVDPLVAQTGQPYAYTGDDPINNTDPTGLICLSAHCLVDTVSSGVNTVKGVVSAGATWVGQHKKVVGVGLGVVSIATGFGAAEGGIEIAGALSATGDQLATASAVFGTGASAIDADGCISNGVSLSNPDCYGAVAGGLGAAFGISGALGGSSIATTLDWLSPAYGTLATSFDVYNDLEGDTRVYECAREGAA